MSELNQREAAKDFYEYWKDKGKEKSEGQKFWLSLLRDVFGIEHPERYIDFEIEVQLDNTKYADGYILKTKVLIEQKGRDKDLFKKYMQSGGVSLTPFEQAIRYRSKLPYSMQPRYIVICNFQEFHIYDMESPDSEPYILKLEDFENEYKLLSFLVEENKDHIHKEMKISVEAGNIIGKLYDLLLEQYKDKQSAETYKSLNRLCVRLVFCLYAEDSGIFEKDMFLEYLRQFEPKHIRKSLQDLFKVLDTPEELRDEYDEELNRFPYVNGGLFTYEDSKIPNFTDEIKNLLLNEASEGFNWSEISPTIFGALFESTLNPQTRRSGGMHYTSIENIHKVIDPLFLDDLKQEFYEISKYKTDKKIKEKLIEFQNKLSTLTFLDPACGSGNFLTEAYLSLRELENGVISYLYKDNRFIENINPIKVSISQFYGIEINDFAVTVAKTALWIAESQMMKKTEDIVHMDLDFLPLKAYANIVEENALRINWEDVVPKEKCNYIMGNPPFVGHQNRTPSQIKDMQIAFSDLSKHGKLDYVCAWYNLAANYMKNTKILTAFVSTNSICQGESVGILWKHLIDSKNVEIQFAYSSFQWNSESIQQAAVYCVIIGFSLYHSKKEKLIYSNSSVYRADYINGYLVDAPNIYIKSRGKTLTSGLPQMTKGSQPTDGGYLLLNEDEYKSITSKYPSTTSFIRRYIGADEFINNKKRFCIWLKDVNPEEYRKIPAIMGRINKVAECRRNSPTESVREDALTSMLFTQIRQPNSDYLVIPQVSSERRRYIPIGYVNKDIICGNANMLIPNATTYMFGILSSNVHNAWMRAICGRLEMRYRYTPATYNNFPWCNPTDEQKAKIEKTAKNILSVRENFKGSSLADLYDQNAMPPELRKAHQENDKAVMEAYGFRKKDAETGKIITLSESEIVAELMKMYKRLTK